MTIGPVLGLPKTVSISQSPIRSMLSTISGAPYRNCIFDSRCFFFLASPIPLVALTQVTKQCASLSLVASNVAVYPLMFTLALAPSKTLDICSVLQSMLSSRSIKSMPDCGIWHFDFGVALLPTIDTLCLAHIALSYHFALVSISV